MDASWANEYYESPVIRWCTSWLALLLGVAVLLAIPAPAPAQSLPLPSVVPPSIFDIVGIMFNLDPSLLQAIASVESGGRAKAVSPKGASGLMQLMPDTARRFGVRDPFNPVESVLGAARFLAYLHEYAGIEDLPQLLAAYNAGEGAVSRYRGLPPYPETREYVRRVLLTYLLSDGPSNVQGSSVHSYRLTRGNVRQRTEPPPISRMSVPGLTEATRPKTETDVLAQLEQIKSARSRVLRAQQHQKQAP
ncbi:MAG: lytic transglycosylase domain-containing protein [Deltaproteobacteria bacterium]|nr:lytic transglycosylase domain-containing protein [Deltaproteobacteria bacterium]